jgi:small-conductance mechanosensitive channel
VMRLLNDAGVEIPFPQRDLRLRSVDASAAATLLSPDSSESLPKNGSDELGPALAPNRIKGRTVGEN